MSGLRRDLGLLEATTVIVGSMIGAGIFLGVSEVAREVEDPFWILVVWALSGILVLLAALTYAELSALIPSSGGDYVFLREAYGKRVAFFDGWSIFNFGKSASLAAVSVGAAHYAENFVSLGTWGVKAAAVLLILALSGINILGVRWGGRLGNVFAFAKVAALGFLVVGAWVASWGSPTHAHLDRGSDPPSIFALGAAMIPALFAYDGWSVSTQVAEEVRSPQKNLPRSLVLGVLLVGGIYVLTNLAYVVLLGPQGLRTTPFAAADGGEVLAGEAGRKAMTLAVLISIVGTANAITVTGPRVAFAMARDGLFPRALSQISRFGTPHVAILAQALWSSLLAVAFDFSALLRAVIFSGWIFYGLAAASLPILRRKIPSKRPYSVPFYPWTPWIVVLLSLFVLASSLVKHPWESLGGLLLLALGAPVLSILERRVRMTVKARLWREFA